MEFGGGAFSGSYSAKSRFEEGEGTNPEELIAAAHAGCFSMALSLGLEQAGHPSETVETTADVHITPAERRLRDQPHRPPHPRQGPRDRRGRVPAVAAATKSGCPVSKALAAVPQINLDAQLAG